MRASCYHTGPPKRLRPGDHASVQAATRVGAPGDCQGVCTRSAPISSIPSGRLAASASMPQLGCRSDRISRNQEAEAKYERFGPEAGGGSCGRLLGSPHESSSPEAAASTRGYLAIRCSNTVSHRFSRRRRRCRPTRRLPARIPTIAGGIISPDEMAADDAKRPVAQITCLPRYARDRPLPPLGAGPL